MASSIKTPRGNLTVAASESEWVQLATAMIQQRIETALLDRHICRLALAGGLTPEPIYRKLAASSINWTRVELFFGDERPVGPNDAQSNFAMASAALIAHLPQAPLAVHRMQGEVRPLANAAVSYAAELVRAFEVTPPAVPIFDLVLLGLGEEGHTASLFPQSPALQATEWVRAVEVEKLGQERLTLTPLVLGAARCVCFLVRGANKAEALYQVFAGELQPELYPAQSVCQGDAAIEVLADEPAAARLLEEYAS